jgi:CRP/FNR family transcriptional regulator
MPQEIKFVYLKNHPLFAELPEEKIKDACSVMKIKTARRGEQLDYGYGDYTRIYLLIKGNVKIADTGDTDNVLVKDILMGPDIFGDLSLMGLPSGDEYAEALTDNTVVCYFQVADFRKVSQSNASMSLKYANTVNAKLKKLEVRHSDLVSRDAKFRLIRFIKTWARCDGSRIGDKIVLNNCLTHSDIAGFISASRQSVNMLLNEMRDSGLLLYSRKRIELNDAMAWN